jgi:hypothetical protein
VKKKNRTSIPKEQDLRLALLKISEMGKGIKPEIIDWQNIGKNAVATAKEVLREKCVECGK